MSTAILWGAWFRRQAIEYRRYLFETISMLVTLYGFFLVIFLGIRAVGGSGPGFGDTLAGLVVSYAVWAIALYAYFAMAQGLVQEAQLGTLEQLAMSPFGLVRVMLANVLTGLVFQFGFVTALLLVMMLTSGQVLHLDVISIVPLFLLTVLGIVGVGFLAGGLAIVFKRVNSALQVMQVGLLALVAAPPGAWAPLKHLPLNWGSHLMRRVMVEGIRLWELPPGDLAYLAANSAFYLLLGIVLFRRFETAARDRALLGHY